LQVDGCFADLLKAAVYFIDYYSLNARKEFTSAKILLFIREAR